MSSWMSLEVRTAEDLLPDSEALELLCTELHALGAEGLELRDAARPVVVIAYFQLSEGVQQEAARLYAALMEGGQPVASVKGAAVPDVDWAEHWRRHFRPLQLGPVWVVPSWLEPPAGAELVLRIDPSRAFGTGLHATTALCAERIAALAPSAPILDVGTGTGILAMIALLCGAPSAVGVENDPDAIEVAEENAEANGLKARLRLSLEPLDALSERFSLVVANILAGPLCELAPLISARLAPGGRLLLSGVLATQTEAVTAAYEAEGLVLSGVAPRDEWVRIELIAPEA